MRPAAFIFTDNRLLEDVLIQERMECSQNEVKTLILDKLCNNYIFLTNLIMLQYLILYNFLVFFKFSSTETCEFVT